jgi:hypothetical protein
MGKMKNGIPGLDELLEDVMLPLKKIISNISLFDATSKK